MTKRVTLSEDISRLVNRGDGEQLEIAFLEMLASDAAVDLNVLGVFMEDIIMSNVDSTTIVTIKRSGRWLWSQPRASEARQAHMWCRQGHDTQPKYWNGKQYPSSCNAIRQEKYPTGNRNLG